MSDPTFEEDSLISQDDIDKLLNSSSIEEAEEKISSSDPISASAADGVDELGELSQDDIDQLMNSNATNPEDSEDGDDSEEDDMELISQDDIDRLMNSNSSSDEEETMESAVENNSQDDDIIDESEAVDVQDSLIAQETIDDLIKSFDNEEISEPVILDEEPVTQPEGQPESEPEPAVPNVQEEIDSDDTEDFLKPDSDAAMLDFDDSESEDVTQDDIDALLLESDDDEETEDDILIFQDDIDALLMATDQEDEDVLGDLMDESVEDYLDDEFEDEDGLENNGFHEDDEDQVVLEEYDEEPPVKPKGKKTKTTSQWYKSKLVIACASALIVLGITVPIAYFMFFPGESGKEVQSDPIVKLAVETQREIEIETVDIHIKKQVDIQKPGNLILKDFVILASDLSKDMAYITADISIDYSDQRAYQEIMNNLSFYRDLIYDSINKSLGSEKRDEITQADILWIVETTLKKVLPGHYINRVSFTSFKVS